jgi:hypothetical protein
MWQKILLKKLKIEKKSENENIATKYFYFSHFGKFWQKKTIGGSQKVEIKKLSIFIIIGSLK